MNTEHRGLDGTAHEEKFSLYVKTLKDTNPALRCCAAQVLGRACDEEALEPLIQALEDEDSWVRKHVVEALGRIRNAKAIPYLEKLVDDNEKPVWCDRTIGEVAREAIELITRKNRAAR